MKVLVTGAGGFLGRRVVARLAERGAAVRALDLPRPAAAPPPRGVEPFHGDVRSAADLSRACAGIGVVVHLAARLDGAASEVVGTAVEGTARLVEAMQAAGAGRLVLASSLSVYDWAAAPERLDEDAPLERRPDARDPYTTAKLEQERIARARCRDAGIGLVVLRPAVLWGAGRELPPTLGQRAGPLHVVIGAGRPLPAVHVDNCADAFAQAALSTASGTFNVVDDPVTALRFVLDHLRRSGRGGFAVPAAYRPALAAVAAVRRLTPASLRSRLPAFLSPERFAARYRPVRVEGSRLRETFRWAPPFSYAQCLDRTYPAAGDAAP